MKVHTEMLNADHVKLTVEDVTLEMITTVGDDGTGYPITQAKLEEIYVRDDSRRHNLFWKDQSTKDVLTLNWTRISDPVRKLIKEKGREQQKRDKLADLRRQVRQLEDELCS